MHSGSSFKELIERIKTVIDMRLWLKELGVKYKKEGYYYCPFHEEKNPSFTATRNIATDWHDNKHYDVISVAMKIKNWTFKETLAKCCEHAGIDTEIFTRNNKSPISEILEYAKYHFLKNKELVLKQFETIKGYSIPEALHNELYYFPTNSSHPQRGRLCLVWYDANNKPLGFVGRALEKNAIKYKYSGILSNEKFSRTCFYNIHKAKNSEKVIIVEGVWDAFIASYYHNSVVATGGIVCPKISMFSDFINTQTTYNYNGQTASRKDFGHFLNLKAVVFAPDPDPQGLQGFINSIEEIYSELNERNLECYAYNLKRDLDETLIFKDIQNINEIYENALHLKEYLQITRNILLEQQHNTQKKVININNLVLAKKIEDKLEVMKDEILQMINNKNIGEYEILKEINKLKLDSEKEKYLNKLSMLRGISRRTLARDLKIVAKEQEQQKETDTLFLSKILSDKTRVVHPAYYVDENVASLGFSVDILDNNEKNEKEEIKTIDFRIVYDDRNKNIILVKNGSFQSNDINYIIDFKNRIPPKLIEYWTKSDIEKILENKEIKSASLKSIYLTIVKVLKKYVELKDEESYHILAIYVIMTYFHSCFTSIPFLFVFGPKGSGKSHLITILQLLCFNAVKLKGITTAALGDTVDSTKSTLIIDQAETLSLPQNLEIIGILADSYSASGGKRRIIQIQNGSRKILELETFSPKIFASTRDLDEDLRDRCVMIQMIKSTKQFSKPNPNSEIWRKIRSELYKNFLKYSSSFYRLYNLYSKSSSQASNRIEELINPFLFLAKQLEYSESEIKLMSFYLNKNIKLTQFEISEDEKTLFETLLDEFGMYDTTIKITEKRLKEILNIRGLTKDNVVKWATAKLKQFNLVEEITKEKQGNKGVKYFLLKKSIVEEIYNRYFFNTSQYDLNKDNNRTDNEYFVSEEDEEENTNISVNVNNTKEVNEEKDNNNNINDEYNNIEDEHNNSENESMEDIVKQAYIIFNS